MPDEWDDRRSEEWGPAHHGVAVTPNDGADLTDTTRALYIGGAGDVRVDMYGSGTVTFVGVAAGTVLPLRADRVYATGTTATSIVALR
jgi:hypothetical protein